MEKRYYAYLLCLDTNYQHPNFGWLYLCHLEMENIIYDFYADNLQCLHVFTEYKGFTNHYKIKRADYVTVYESDMLQYLLTHQSIFAYKGFNYYLDNTDGTMYSISTSDSIYQKLEEIKQENERAQKTKADLQSHRSNNRATNRACHIVKRLADYELIGQIPENIAMWYKIRLSFYISSVTEVVDVFIHLFADCILEDISTENYLDVIVFRNALLKINNQQSYDYQHIKNSYLLLKFISFTYKFGMENNKTIKRILRQVVKDRELD